jgi:hypothetical protein
VQVDEVIDGAEDTPELFSSHAMVLCMHKSGHSLHGSLALNDAMMLQGLLTGIGAHCITISAAYIRCSSVLDTFKYFSDILPRSLSSVAEPTMHR